MSAVLKDNRISIEDYLSGELVSEIKHEYEEGYIYAMSGASVNHDRISKALARKLADHLDDTPCEVLGQDVKVYVAESKFYYPDLMVICNHEKGGEYYTDKPILIVEVLSDSTQRKDRTVKRWAYQRLPSLQEYVLIEQNFVEIEVSRRSANWDSTHYFLGDEVFFQSLALKLPVEEIYRRVDNEDMREFLKQSLDLTGEIK
jgi:Uma2 family endonuclease